MFFHRYTPFARSFFSPDLGRRLPLGDGIESWRGFYQSIRPTQMGLSLNIGKGSPSSSLTHNRNSPLKLSYRIIFWMILLFRIFLFHLRENVFIYPKFPFCAFPDMSATAFIEPLPIINFVVQLLRSDIHSRPLSDAERVKVFLLN